MGYGEFGGGGSVLWRVVHGDKGQKGKERDPLPQKGAPDSKFRVYIDDKLVGETSVDSGRVRVVWTPDTKQSSDEDLKDKNSKDPHTAPAAG